MNLSNFADTTSTELKRKIEKLNKTIHTYNQRIYIVIEKYINISNNLQELSKKNKKEFNKKIEEIKLFDFDKFSIDVKKEYIKLVADRNAIVTSVRILKKMISGNPELISFSKLKVKDIMPYQHVRLKIKKIQMQLI